MRESVCVQKREWERERGNEKGEIDTYTNDREKKNGKGEVNLFMFRENLY